MSSAEPRPSGGRRLLAAALPVLLAVQLTSVPLLAAPAMHGRDALAFVAALHVLLAFALHLSLRAGRSLGWIATAAAALCVGAVVVCQLRLEAERPTGTATSLAAALGVALLAVLLTGRPAQGDGWKRPLAGGIALFLITASVAATGYRQSPLLRWHLLHHHRIFGLPLFHLLSRPIPVERARLWTGQSRLVEPWERAGEAAGPEPDAGSGAPHLVCVLVDTLRADALEAWGGERSWMPRTNELAESSAVLARVIANSSWTRASVASLFTGLQPEEHGAVRYHDKLADGWVTLAERLDESGYQGAAFVSNWVQVGRETGFDQGFEVFQELLGDVEAAGRAKYARAATVTDAVLEWLAGEERRQAAEAGRPAFLYVHYLDPHSPYLSGPEPGLEPGTGAGVRESRRGAYRQELRYLDGELDRLVRGLDELLDGRVVLLLTSDHGEEFWEHGEWGHGRTLYPEVLDIPAFVRVSARGRVLNDSGRSEARLELRDLHDLLLRAARPGELDAVSWAAERSRTVRYASQYLDRAAPMRPDKRHTALRRVESRVGEDEGALIWSGFGPTLELYRASDPAELENRIGKDPELGAELERRMRSAVRFWSASPRVQRSADARAFLRDLGYAGGVDEDGP